jgi:hypothetical protein
MSTRSRIGIELQNGSIVSAYCHWDGYPEFNGVKLVEHFNSYDAATALIDGGDISSLWTDKGWDQQGFLLKMAHCIMLTVVRIVLLVLMLTCVSICFLLVLKSMPICLQMENGCAII